MGCIMTHTLSAGQILNQRYSIVHFMEKNKEIEVYRAIDTHNNQEVDVLCPSAKELMEAEQPNLFYQTHHNILQFAGQHSPSPTPPTKIEGLSIPSFVGFQDKLPFAVYPKTKASWHAPVTEKTLSPTEALSIGKRLLYILETHTSLLQRGLQYEECCTGEDGTIHIRELGNTNKQQKINIDSTQHPQNPIDPHFALAMILIQSQFGPQQFSNLQNFSQWISSQSYKSKFDTSDAQSMQLQTCIEAIWTKDISTVLPISSRDVSYNFASIAPIATPHTPVTTVATTTSPRISKARLDIPLQTYVIVAKDIVSPSLVRQIAAVCGVSVENITQLQKQYTEIPLLSFATEHDAQQNLSLFRNIPITTKVTPATGIWHSGKIQALSMLGLTASGILLALYVFQYLPLIPVLLAFLLSIAFVLTKEYNARTNQERLQGQWKQLQGIGVQKNTWYAQLQETRKAILLSELPSLAIYDYIKILDEMEDSMDVKNPTTHDISMVQQTTQTIQQHIRMGSEQTFSSSTHTQRMQDLESLRQAI